MKVIIAYASAGAGHLKAAESLKKYFSGRIGEQSVKLLDVLDFTNIAFRITYTLGYSFLVRHLPSLWSFIFFITGSKLLYCPLKMILFVFNRYFAREFIDTLTRENPDVIISTHFLPPELAASLKKTGKINSYLVTVITDLGVHPFWVTSGVDNYMVSTEITKSLLIGLGVSDNIINITGIPVDNKFMDRVDRNELAKKFGINLSMPVILVATGSFGIGPIKKIVKSLSPLSQILVVCANNKKLYTYLSNIKLKNVSVFGFVDYMDELMRISDIIITKPGGLTISESLVMGVAPIFVVAIPGQERKNLDVLLEYGIGVDCTNCSCIDAAIDLLKNPKKLIEIKERISVIRKPDALKEIFDVVCKNSPGSCG